MTSKDFLPSVPTDLGIVLIGKVGAGKTAVMNSILRCSQKNEETTSNTKMCQNVCINGQNVVIVDTPGLCDAEKTDDEVIDEIRKALPLAHPGPHVFLIVLDLQRFTQECQEMVETIWKSFGEDAAQFAVALFTHGDELKKRGKPIKKFIGESTELNNFVSKCKGGFYAVDNNNQDPAEVTKLLQFINNVVNKNGGKAYTQEMQQMAIRNSGIRRKIALSVSGSAMAGAGVGGVATYFSGSTIGVPIGAAAGGAVGGVMGAVGIVAAQHIKANNCVIQ
ncbi:GTPase IMAP family member 9-like [Betta splendens]|uniref:GTPase IMAP family member 9-like n=1 Tax=Betta splendens TaxID=158456 RepID=A0A9W2XYH5_BETSP|nr:GTPase IMAP family member 9-like [Betta splendens]